MGWLLGRWLFGPPDNNSNQNNQNFPRLLRCWLFEPPGNQSNQSNQNPPWLLRCWLFEPPGKQTNQSNQNNYREALVIGALVTQIIRTPW